MISLFISSVPLNLLSAQSIAIATNSGGLVKIETKLDIGSPISNTTPDYESSVGFFYRLEDVNNHYSYFWPNTIYDDIDDTKETAMSTLELPNGTYQVIAYESRKSKPIRTTALASGTPFTVTGSSYQFPEINLGGSELHLYSSWNIYWHEFPAYTTVPEHNTSPANTYLPPTTEPWVFMTLVKKDWMINAPIQIEFPDFLSYGGFIWGNEMNSTKIGATVSNTLGAPQSLSISNNGTVPANQQVIIHLIFKKNGNYIPSDTYPGAASFKGSYDTLQVGPGGTPDTVLVDTTFVFKPKPKPHDPNRLAVDKKELCECGFNEYLTYRIDYQNDGEAPTDTVMVSLMDLNHLHPATIQHNNDTDGHMAPINYNLNYTPPKNEFLIKYPKGLPGLKQNSKMYPKVVAEACQDYLYIKVKKEDCLAAGTKIQPKAKITFAGTKDTIYTNLDETLIVASSECKSCPPNLRCPGCPRKEPCWLFRWFRRKNKH